MAHPSALDGLTLDLRRAPPPLSSILDRKPQEQRTLLFMCKRGVRRLMTYDRVSYECFRLS